jgi:succinylglutamic semialdehyde dehydrogenase
VAAGGIPTLSTCCRAEKTGQALLENRDIDGVLFTGSAAAGFHFHRYFGGQPEKMLALEMGGNNALIVADVADAMRRCM